MADPPDELEALKAHLASLTARVYRLEQRSQLVSEPQTPTTPGRPPGAALQPPLVLPASVEPLPSAPPQGQPKPTDPAYAALESLSPISTSGPMRMTYDARQHEIVKFEAAFGSWQVV